MDRDSESIFYDNWLDKRMVFDHFDKIIKSGISFSAHSIHGWGDQFFRMLRFQERALKSNDENEILDFTIAFFQNCYHLKDWVPTFENIEEAEWQKIWQPFIEQNECIRYCRDICNGTKHLKIDNPSVDADFSIYRDYEEVEGYEDGKFISWNLLADDKKITLNQLMEDCVVAWKILLKEIIDKNAPNKRLNGDRLFDAV